MHKATWIVLLWTSVAFAPAGPIVVYGDSLSDNGNMFAVRGAPLPPYWQGRYSNGPVAVEDLAAMLGLPLLDYAYGGAQTGNHNITAGYPVPGMLDELALSQAAVQPLASQTLFIVWGGPNDLYGNVPAATAVANLVGIVETLESWGARRILVPGMIDLGLVPALEGNPAGAAIATQYAQTVNAGLRAHLPSGAAYIDMFSLTDDMAAHPAAYGLTNVTAACWNGVTECGTPDTYMFWDAHPTTHAHTILAARMAGYVPEPASFVLVASALGALLWRLGGRSRAPQPSRARLAGLPQCQRPSSAP